MKIKPARGIVLIEPLEAEETSAGGVYLPDRVKDMPQKGKVLAVGESRFLGERHRDPAEGMGSKYVQIWDSPPCKVGDTVIFKRFVDNRIKEEGRELLLVKFEDILGVYEEEKNN